MTKPTFQPVTKDRAPMGEPVEFTPIIFMAGTETHRLALHKQTGLDFMPESKKPWVVSHPVIGAKILEVIGSYKGMPVSSAGYRVSEARTAALASLDALCERIGAEAFNRIIKNQTERA